MLIDELEKRVAVEEISVSEGNERELRVAFPEPSMPNSPPAPILNPPLCWILNAF
jgi:hypothetical protein